MARPEMKEVDDTRPAGDSSDHQQTAIPRDTPLWQTSLVVVN